MTELLPKSTSLLRVALSDLRWACVPTAMSAPSSGKLLLHELNKHSQRAACSVDNKEQGMREHANIAAADTGHAALWKIQVRKLEIQEMWREHER